MTKWFWSLISGNISCSDLPECAQCIGRIRCDCGSFTLSPIVSLTWASIAAEGLFEQERVSAWRPKGFVSFVLNSLI